MCGFVGLIGLPGAAEALRIGLHAVQHRGQDAAGVGVFHRGQATVHKDVGMVPQALPTEALARLVGSAGVGHVRYPTVGGSSRQDAQPFTTRRPSMVLAHNGNVINLVELEEQLAGRGIRLTSTCDAESILAVLGDELLKLRVVGHTLDDLAVAVRATLQTVRGGYSVVAVLEIDGQESLIAFRDAHGIRPAVYGRHPGGGWAAASESVSLDVLGFALVGDVPPGTLMVFRPGQAPLARDVGARPAAHCIFEDIYFARPDSRMEGVRINQRRWDLGTRLAQAWEARGFQADVVVAIPDTSRPAAQAMAEALRLPFREGFIKNRYSGRTFIMPDQASREAALRLKLNPIEEVFRGRRVVLVDDSIVRGSTIFRIVQLLKGLGPAALHVAIFSPAVRHPCFYGIDMPSSQELVASRYPAETLQEELAKYLDCASVTFLSPEALAEVAGPDLCAACFTGRYVVPLTDRERSSILADRRPEV
jgi:amidophosphoribosyltransferase